VIDGSPVSELLGKVLGGFSGVEKLAPVGEGAIGAGLALKEAHPPRGGLSQTRRRGGCELEQLKPAAVQRYVSELLSLGGFAYRIPVNRRVWLVAL